MSRPEGWEKPMPVGHRVRLWREFRELSLQGLADAAGMPKSTLSDLEAGKTKLGTYIGDLASALGVRHAYLKSGKGEPEETDSSSYWPFPGIPRARIRELGRFEQHFLETRLREGLEEIEEERRKGKTG